MSYDPRIRELRLRLRLLGRLSVDELPGELFACADIAARLEQPAFATFLRSVAVRAKATILDAARGAVWVENNNASIVDMFELITRAQRQAKTKDPKIAIKFIIDATIIAEKLNNPALAEELTNWARAIKALPD